MGPIQATIKRILADKILLGLVMAGFLIISVGAFFTQDDDTKSASNKPGHPVAAVTATAPTAPAAPPHLTLEAPLAADFVKWWMTCSMDFQPSTATKSHQEANKWITPDALKTFQANYWSPEIERGVTTGQIVAQFQPSSVQPEAINPDGSVVVSANGVLAVQANGTPLTQQFAADFLVKKEKEGLRIEGVYNRNLAAAAPSGAAPPSY